MLLANNIFGKYLDADPTITSQLPVLISVYVEVATGQGKVREIQGQGKVREF